MTKLRDLAGEDHIKLERLAGSRGESGYFLAALSCLEFLLDGNRYGLQAFVKALDKGKAKQSRLHDALAVSAHDPVIRTELRALIFFQCLLWRPMTTYIQSDKSSKHDTIEIWKDFAKVTQQILAWSNTEGATLGDLPWLEVDEHGRTVLLRVALHTRVLCREEEVEQERIACWVGQVGRDGLLPKREATRRRKARERVQVAVDARIARRKAAMAHVFNTPNLVHFKVLVREMTIEVIASHERIHSEHQYEGIILQAAGIEHSAEYERLKAQMLRQARSCPSTSKLIEGFIGEFGYARDLNPNCTDQSTSHIMALREIKLAEMLWALKERDPKKFHEIMNNARAFEKILTNRVKARVRLQLVRKDSEMDSDLQQGEVRVQKRTDLRTEREALAAGWQHVPHDEFSSGILALFPDLSPAKRRDAITKHLTAVLLMFKQVHAAHTIDELKHVYFGKNNQGGFGYRGAYCGTQNHTNENGDRVKVTNETMILHAWQVSKYMEQHKLRTNSYPLNFAGKVFEINDSVIVTRDGKDYEGRVMVVNNLNSYDVRIADITWTGLLEMRDDVGPYTMQMFSCDKMRQKLNADQRPTRQRRTNQRNVEHQRAEAEHDAAYGRPRNRQAGTGARAQAPP
jgi:hypothetical protein